MRRDGGKGEDRVTKPNQLLTCNWWQSMLDIFRGLKGLTKAQQVGIPSIFSCLLLSEGDHRLLNISSPLLGIRFHTPRFLPHRDHKTGKSLFLNMFHVSRFELWRNVWPTWSLGCETNYFNMHVITRVQKKKLIW